MRSYGRLVAGWAHRQRIDLLCCAALICFGVLVSFQAWSGPIRWTPDGIAYEAKALQYSGVPRSEAIHRAYSLEIAPEEGKKVFPTERSFDSMMVWYRRQVLVPGLAARLHPVFGVRSLLVISLTSFVLLGVAFYAFLRQRFAAPYAAAVSGLALLFPPLHHWAVRPLTDVPGLLWVVLALTCAVLSLTRSRWWLLPWALCIAAGSVTRESVAVPVLAALVLVVLRTPRAVPLLLSGLAAVAPAMLLLRFPFQEAFALSASRQLHEHVEPTIGSIAREWPLLAMRQVYWNLRLEPVSTALLVLAFVRLGYRSDRTVCARVARAAGLGAVIYLASFPFLTSMRLELALMPAAVFGFALLAEDITALARRTFRGRVSTAVSG